MLEIIKNGLVYIFEVHWRSLKRGSFSKMDNEHKKIFFFLHRGNITAQQMSLLICTNQLEHSSKYLVISNMLTVNFDKK